MGEAHDITVRMMEVEAPVDLDPLGVVEGRPEESAVNVGLSLLLPYLEPYLIRSMNKAKSQVTSEALRIDIDNFNGQEGQHYRQHKKFNDLVRDKGYDRLAELEAELLADYRRFSEEKSLRFNLAYAEGFEAFTCSTALFSFEYGLIERFHPAAKELFLWHLIEEVEHRTVAFDVYDHVYGGWLYRLFVGLYAQWHMGSWVLKVSNYLLASNKKRLVEEFGGARGWRARMLPFIWLQLRHLLPRVLRTYLPWYNPSRVVVPEATLALAAHYTRVANRPAT